MKQKITPILLGSAIALGGAIVYFGAQAPNDTIQPLAEAPTAAPNTGNPSRDILRETIAQQNTGPQSSSITTSDQGLEEPSVEEPFGMNDPAFAWSKVDLDAIRNEIPNNLFWEIAAPTEDEALKAQRKEQKDYWNKQYGKVLSNTATEEEIRAYYGRQNEVSNDMVEFATMLINRHGQDLPEESYGLQTLARNLHLGRLEEIPGKLADALDRRKEFVETRNEWLADKAGYEAKLAAEREAALREMGKI